MGEPKVTDAAELSAQVKRVLGDRIVEESGGAKDFAIAFGKSIGRVRVKPDSGGRGIPLLRIDFPVLIHAPASQQLWRFFATHASDVLLGGLVARQVSGKGVNVWLTYTVIGDSLDDDELFTTVARIGYEAWIAAKGARDEFGGEHVA